MRPERPVLEGGASGVAGTFNRCISMCSSFFLRSQERARVWCIFFLEDVTRAHDTAWRIREGLPSPPYICHESGLCFEGGRGGGGGWKVGVGG